METLFEIQKIILDQFIKEPFYQRTVCEDINIDNRITGIIGSRGIGKTTFLLKQILLTNREQQSALYISADNTYFVKNKLIHLVDQLYKETDVRLLCIDEIHKYQNWQQELKNIYDIYRNFQILFTGSSMIDILHSKYDLSRRVILSHMYGLSFREYLEFAHGIKISRITIKELISNHIEIASSLQIPHILKYFKDYLKNGYYPFFKEFKNDHDRFQAIENIVQKTIYEDISTLHSLKSSSLSTIEKIFKYILNSVPGELSVYKLANSLEKNFESISDFFNFLEQAGLIRFIFPKKSGKAFLRNPIKVFPENTNLLYASYIPLLEDNTIGKIRETFLVNQLQNANVPIFYSEIGDFMTDNFILEVGGKNKTPKQIKNQKNAYIAADGILLGNQYTVPLYLFGFLT